MSTAPTLGPNTPEGRAISSKNATTTGLYTANAYIRPGEQSLYAEMEEAIQAELAPEGMLECRLAEEIIGALWRLRRCHTLEAESTPTEEETQPETAHTKRQLSLERARNHATRLLHKNTAELRRLQTERRYRNEISGDGIRTAGFGVCDVHTAFSNADRTLKSAERRPLDQLELKLKTMALASKLESAEINRDMREITKRTPPPDPQKPKPLDQTLPEIPRNAPCPCDSGQKYKRCCGKTAPPLLHHLSRAA